MAKDEWQNLGLVFANDQEAVAQAEQNTAEKGK